MSEVVRYAVRCSAENARAREPVRNQQTGRLKWGAGELLHCHRAAALSPQPCSRRGGALGAVGGGESCNRRAWGEEAVLLKASQKHH